MIETCYDVIHGRSLVGLHSHSTGGGGPASPVLAVSTQRCSTASRQLKPASRLCLVSSSALSSATQQAELMLALVQALSRNTRSLASPALSRQQY